MTNPWKELECIDNQWVLPQDACAIRTHNAQKRLETHRVCLASLPEPFIGDPSSARIVFLGLNPGHEESDIEFHRDPAMRNAILLNLRHELSEFPFYPLNPKFETTGVGQWWRRRLKHLQASSELDWKLLSQRVLALEWFPYHSKSSGLPTEKLCSSQEYGFYLARNLATQRNVKIIGMKAKARWSRVLEGKQIDFLNSAQNSYLTPKNMRPGLFEEVLKSLQ